MAHRVTARCCSRTRQPRSFVISSIGSSNTARRKSSDLTTTRSSLSATWRPSMWRWWTEAFCRMWCRLTSPSWPTSGSLSTSTTMSSKRCLRTGAPSRARTSNTSGIWRIRSYLRRVSMRRTSTGMHLRTRLMNCELRQLPPITKSHYSYLPAAWKRRFKYFRAEPIRDIWEASAFRRSDSRQWSTLRCCCTITTSICRPTCISTASKFTRRLSRVLPTPNQPRRGRKWEKRFYFIIVVLSWTSVLCGPMSLIRVPQCFTFKVMIIKRICATECMVLQSRWPFNYV